MVPFLPPMKGLKDARQGEWTFQGNWQKQKQPLHIFTDPLKSPTVAFLARLCINIRPPQQLDASEFMALASMPNLGMLEIIVHEDASVTGFDDRLIRSWSLWPDAFPRLRLLRLGGPGAELTPACLSYARQLTSLVVLELVVSHYKSSDWGDDAVQATCASMGWVSLVFDGWIPQNDATHREGVTEMVLGLVDSAQRQALRQVTNLFFGPHRKRWRHALEERAEPDAEMPSSETLLERKAMRRAAPLLFYDFLSEYDNQVLCRGSAAQRNPPTHLPMATLVLDSSYLDEFVCFRDKKRVVLVRTKRLSPASPNTSTPTTDKKRPADSESDGKPRLRKTRKMRLEDLLPGF